MTQEMHEYYKIVAKVTRPKVRNLSKWTYYFGRDGLSFNFSILWYKNRSFKFSIKISSRRKKLFHWQHTMWNFSSTKVIEFSFLVTENSTDDLSKWLNRLANIFKKNPSKETYVLYGGRVDTNTHKKWRTLYLPLPILSPH